MVKKKWGRIVNLGSIGVKFGGGMSNLPYSLSKFGLEFFPNNTKKWIKDNVFINTLRVVQQIQNYIKTCQAKS